jgi:hypothetical protein
MFQLFQLFQPSLLLRPEICRKKEKNNREMVGTVGNRLAQVNVLGTNNVKKPLRPWNK